MKFKQYKRGHVLFKAGDPCQFNYLMCLGIVNKYNNIPNDKLITEENEIIPKAKSIEDLKNQVTLRLRKSILKAFNED